MTLFLERRDLLARFRAGERRALEEAYRFYAPVVATFLGRGFTFKSGDRTVRFDGFNDPFDVDNALAETFIRAFRDPARLGYDGLRPYKNYLLTIARNHVIDVLRSRDGSMIALVGDGVLSEHAETAGQEAQAATPERDLLEKELAGLCERFVGKLGERDRTFFLARFQDSRTQVEAGQTVGLSHMQARTLEAKLRGRLLDFLHTSGYLEGHHAHRGAESAR